MKAFTFIEAAFYPKTISQSENENVLKQLLRFTRFSAGFGVALPLSPQISVLIFYNALNLNT